MFGQTMGTLNVYVVDQPGYLPQPAWSMTGNVGNKWMQQNVEIEKTTDFRVGVFVKKRLVFT